jgi:ABC-type bacteriocin/lantibiotic exporter with double-glycine peptidase domain
MAQQTPGNLLKATQKLLKILQLDKKDVSAIYFFAILNGLIALVLPLGIQSIVSFVLAGTISTSIVILVLIVLIGVFFNGLVQVRQMQVIEKVKQKIFTRYTLEFADKIPKLNIQKLDKYYLPELFNRYFDVPSLTKSIDKLLLDIPTAVIQICFGLLLLTFYHPIFIGFGLLLLVTVVVIVRFTSAQGLETSMRASDFKYQIAGWLQEMSRVIKNFKFSKNTILHISKTDSLVTEYLGARTEHFKILLIQYWSLIAFKIIITAAMLIVGVILLVDNEINVGQFIAADIVILAIIASVEKLITTLDKIYDTLTSIQKISKVIDSEVEKNGSLDLPNLSIGVEIDFKDVYFSYQDNEKVLDRVNMHIKAGELVCISGNSGSGKSSLLRLITGAFDNYEGNVLIDNVPVQNYHLRNLRSQIGVLINQQDIFNGTLLENLTLGNPNIHINDVTAMADKLGLKEFIQGYKHGYDAVIDPLGKRLSASIRQEILLVRALIGKKRLLLLESPFSNLDPQERINLMEHLQQEKKHTTIIITSNDASVQSKCDVVYKLEKGRIVK